MAVLMSKVYAVLVLTARRLIQVKTNTLSEGGEVCPGTAPICDVSVIYLHLIPSPVAPFV